MEPTELRNEFARVSVAIDRSGNGPRLLVIDLKSDQSAYFDPLELEQLAWTAHSELEPLLDPARRTGEESVEDPGENEDHH